MALSRRLPEPAGAVPEGERAVHAGTCGSSGRQPLPAAALEAPGGDAPNPAHLLALLTISEAMELRDGILMCPNRDFPEGVDVEVLRARADWLSSPTEESGPAASATAS